MLEFQQTKTFFHVVITGRCPSLNVAHGNVNYNKSPGSGKYPSSTTVSITCDPGYYGPSEATCSDSGQWGEHAPRCDQSNIINKLL